MAESKLLATVRQQAGKAIIDLDGEINAFAEDTLLEAYHQAESEDVSTILLNFQEVEYINSTGIALIVSLLAQARKAHRKIVVYGLSDHYIEIFEITRLADFMTITENESAALSA
jgi:anti-anti-sigma factor